MSESAVAGRARTPATLFDSPERRLLPAALRRMSPVRFGTCFGWLHPARGPSRSSAGVVLCAPMGQDARNVHRQWRLIADRLADAGHPVLRFDYPDTGDSWIATGIDPLEAWIDSIGQAASFLHDHGANRVTLLGLRFGGTLAALAYARLCSARPCSSHVTTGHQTDNAGWIDRLILLAPAVSGRSYVRELRAYARLTGNTTAGEADLIEAGGLAITPTTAAGIAAIDLRREAFSGTGAVLLLDPWDTPIGHSFATHLRSGSADVNEEAGRLVTEGAFPDYEALLDSAHTNRFPERTVARIIDWLAVTAPSLPVPNAAPRLPDMSMRAPGWREKPCQFGEDAQLFAVLCEPEADVAASDIALVICNNGSNPHHGHGRFAVSLARTLAKQGFASLRLDFAGLGDSPGAPEEERPHLFDAARGPEITAALAVLEKAGYRRFVLTGICAGAYHAFHGALADHRVVGLYAVNMPKFRWPVGDDPDIAIRQSLHATSYYVGSFRRKRTWQRLLRGKIDVRTIARTLLGRLGRRAAASIVLPVAARFGHPSGAGFPRWSLATLSQRGTRVHFALSHDDPGVEEMVRCFGTDGRKVGRMPGCSVELTSDLDHAISDTKSRDALQQRLVAFMLALARG